MLPKASIVIRGQVFPVAICAAAFQGGILETQANIAKGSLVSLNLMSTTPAKVTIHVLEISAGKMVFRLYGTDGPERGIWDQLVRDFRDSKDSRE